MAPLALVNLRKSLLEWYDISARKLPWRATKDPYKIWLSEVMLQQTQVSKVLDYYERFTKRFPSVESLARASIHDVLSMWSGLGYYSRARNLHKAALEIVEKHHGQLPKIVDELLALPGFGRYTAGAVASIAYDVEAPIVDGNVARILTRIFLIDWPVADKRREKWLWQKAGELSKGKRPGDFNQSMMELGATVCLPKNPMCLVCPVMKICEARKAGREAEIPPAKVRAARKALRANVYFVKKKNRFLVVRRKNEGLFGGLWELPSIENAESAKTGFEMIFSQAPRNLKFVATVSRTLTHKDLWLDVYSAPRLEKVVKNFERYEDAEWVTHEEYAALGRSSAMVEVMKTIAHSQTLLAE